MSKLDQLKNWFTLAEAAKHLGSVLKESVTIENILRLARDGHLQLAADFPNHATGILCQIINRDEADNTGTTINDLLNDPNKAILLSDDTTIINKIWNIPSYGDAKSLIEKRYQELTSEVTVNRTTHQGVFFEHPEDPTNIIKVMSAGKTKRPESPFHILNFCQANSLPDDCVLVVTKPALEKFIEKHAPRAKAKTSMQSTQSTNRQFETIRALAQLAIGKSSGSSYKDAMAVVQALETRGITCPVSEKTLQKYLDPSNV